MTQEVANFFVAEARRNTHKPANQVGKAKHHNSWFQGLQEEELL
jgi:hypothetical protein